MLSSCPTFLFPSVVFFIVFPQCNDEWWEKARKMNEHDESTDESPLSLSANNLSPSDPPQCISPQIPSGPSSLPRLYLSDRVGVRGPDEKQEDGNPLGPSECGWNWHFALVSAEKEKYAIFHLSASLWSLSLVEIIPAANCKHLQATFKGSWHCLQERWCNWQGISYRWRM